MSRIRAVTMGAGAVALGVGGLAALARYRWSQEGRRLSEALRDELTAQGRVYRESDLAGLPEPVQRYFRTVLRPGQPYLAAAFAQQEGQFRLSAKGDWLPFQAHQLYTADPVGFVWEAKMRMAPLVSVSVRDSYHQGSGATEARVASLLTVGKAASRHELDEGALHRYLAEAVLFPTALLPHAGVQWSPVSDDAALATLVCNGHEVSLEFRFGASGEVVEAFTPARYRSVEGDFSPAPWECAYSEYEEVDGVRIPRSAEVAWLLPEGRFSYYRGRTQSLEFIYD